MLKKIAAVALLVMIGSTAAMSPAAAQGPPDESSGTITVESEDATLIRQAGRVTFLAVETELTFEGHFEGTAQGSYTKIVHPRGFVNPAGTGVCECEVDGEEGTVVFRTRVIVNFVTGDVHGGGTVISADGDLAGLRGQSQLFPIDPVTFGYTGKTHFAGQ
jgi:hypothetical protein